MRSLNFLLPFILGLLFVTPAMSQELLDKTITVDGLEREYLLYIPAAYDGSEEWPLVLNLHGYQFNGGAQVSIARMNPVADTAHFLIAYPTGQDIDLSAVEGVPPFIPSQGVGWNLGGNLSEYDDITFLEQMIDEILAEYQVDESRVYSCGLSMGGITSYMLACTLSDRIAAVAPVAASMLPEEGGLGFPCVPNSPVPVFQIHGTNDIVDPYEEPWGTLGAPNSIDYWVNQNGCDSDPLTTELEDTDTTDESTVTSIKYQACNESSEVWLYRVNDGGHNWPGGAPLPPAFEFLGPVNRDINASVEIWNFFNRHSRPQPQLEERTITVDGLERECLLYIPAAYDGSEEWPLVFNLHGAGSNPEEQLSLSGMNAVADTGHFLVAYPLGIQNGEGLEGTGWNTSLQPDFQDDVLFISNLIDTIANDYSVDLDRVYTCGMSNGGGMSVTLACELPERLAAVASVASPGILENCDPQRPMPLMSIQGTEDLFVPFNGGPSIALPDLNIELPPARDHVQFWLDNNGCILDSTVIEFEDIVPDDNSTISARRFTNCETYIRQDGVEQSAEVWFYIIENGGHVWPGPELPDFFGNSNLDINASVEIWNFFNRHSLATTTTTHELDATAINLRAYPNPVSDQFIIEFELPQSNRIQVDLYNPLGQRVANIANQFMEAGAHRLQWKAERSGVPAGLYYYRLQVGDQVVSRPVVFMR